MTSSWPVLKRVAAFGRPYTPVALGVVAASSVYSLSSAFMIWFLGRTIFAGDLPVENLPRFLQGWLAPLATSQLAVSQVLLWGGAGTLVVAGSAYLKGLGSGLVVWRVIADLRQRLCDRFLSLDLGFHQGRKTGDLLSRLNNDVTYTQNAVNFIFQDLLQQPVSILTGLLFLVALDWRLTAASLVILPLVVWPLRHFSKKIRKAGEQGAVSLGEITQAIHQILSGIRIVKAFGTETREAERFRDINKHFFRKMMSIVRARALSGALMEFLAYGVFATGGGVLLTWLIREGMIQNLKPGVIGVFVLIGVQKVFSPIRTLGKSIGNVQATLPGAARVFELLDTRPAVEDAPRALPLAPLAREIAFEGITFSYDGASPVLQDVTLRVPKGAIVAVVGPSGSGKSTLLSLLPRFYDPREGRVAIDGTDLRTVRRDSLLGQVAVVTQDPFLFHTTIRENIAYGKAQATPAEVEAAARAANIHEAILKLPRGYDTVVGERGLNLSGGERQRIAIARALLKDAGILILDEATSSLDSESERAVQQALDRLMQGRTTLVIAHRLSTILHADSIAVLEAGRLVAQGTHAELMDQQGLYRRLYEIQFAHSQPAGAGPA